MLGVLPRTSHKSLSRPRLRSFWPLTAVASARPMRSAARLGAWWCKTLQDCAPVADALPGLDQSAPAAEFYAVAVACKAAAETGIPVHIVSDCLAVSKLARKARAGHKPLSNDLADQAALCACQRRFTYPPYSRWLRATNEAEAWERAALHRQYHAGPRCRTDLNGSER